MKNTNFMQVVELTHKQKIAMYMKLKKKKLIEMLIECNRIIEEFASKNPYYAEAEANRINRRNEQERIDKKKGERRCCEIQKRNALAVSHICMD